MTSSTRIKVGDLIASKQTKMIGIYLGSSCAEPWKGTLERPQLYEVYEVCWFLPITGKLMFQKYVYYHHITERRAEYMKRFANYATKCDDEEVCVTDDSY